MALSRRLLLAAGVTAPITARAAGQQSSPAAQPTPLTAGIMLPLTGAYALIGDECARGIQLAADDINEAGGIAGKPLALIHNDVSAQAQAGDAAKSLIAAHASFLLGTGTSALSYPASAAAELAQEPYIELTATADGITTRGFKFLLRTCQTTSMIAATAAAAISARLKTQKLGLLFNTGATSGAIAAAAIAAFKAQKIDPLLVIGYPEAIADLHEPVGRMRRAGIQILLHAGGADDVLLLFQAMQDTKWQPASIFGCADGYTNRDTAYAIGTPFDGVFAIGAPFYPPRAAYLADAYQNRYGMAPRSAESLTAYVGAKLVFDTLNQTQGDPTKLLDTLRSTNIPPGTLANNFGAAFDKSGQNTRSFAILQQWHSLNLSIVS
jgi:branched-chain amino acid transport system substrate-binding protein